MTYALAYLAAVVVRVRRGGRCADGEADPPPPDLELRDVRLADLLDPHDEIAADCVASWPEYRARFAAGARRPASPRP